MSLLRTPITDGPDELIPGQAATFKNCTREIGCTIKLTMQVGQSSGLDMVAVLPSGERAIGWFDTSSHSGWINLPQNGEEGDS